MAYETFPLLSHHPLFYKGGRQPGSGLLLLVWMDKRNALWMHKAVTRTLDGFGRMK